MLEGRLEEAEALLDDAESILSRGQLLFWLARLHVTAGDLAIARQDTAQALSRAAEALTIAAPRNMRLVHADALIIRGRARMLDGRPESAARALDDAEEALRLARECGYVWAERDGLILAAEVRTALAVWHEGLARTAAASREREEAQRARIDANAISATLILTKEDLAKADAKAAARLEELGGSFGNK